MSAVLTGPATSSVAGPATEAAVEDNSHAGQGSVLLDIGGDIGALVIYADEAMAGLEIEIRPAMPAGAADHRHADDHDHDHDHGNGHEHPHRDAHDHRHGHLPHVAVLGRPANGRVHYTAVFPELHTGSYELYVRPFGPVRLSVSVSGGSVTEVTWPV